MIYWRFSTEIIGKFLSGAWYRLNPLWLWSKTTFQDYFKNIEIWTEWVKYRNMWFWYWFLLYRDLFHGRQLIGDRVTWRSFLSNLLHEWKICWSSILDNGRTYFFHKIWSKDWRPNLIFFGQFPLWLQINHDVLFILVPNVK
jgi:hypothetical protein